MAERPKRRKHRDNPYTLQYCEKNKEYKVSFKDSSGNFQNIEVTSTIYKILDEFELKDLAELNEFDRHIEHSEVYEESLHTRVVDKPMELEDSVIRKATFEELKNAINTLPDIQKRRIKLYFFDEKTFEEIAELEHCTKRAVKFSVDIALDKLKEILKK